ncbi:efflux RND transporter permease subunit, partial [Bacteroides intestinalis]|uniref:efflux RND transporter permease subunit n=1 Tax=Bacteroides intestinalis TaxID=329854 RepID=UPI001E3FF48B
IVVVEGVHAKLDQGYKSARTASIDAMSELGGAIVSITLVMMSVFIPVSFMGGTAGTFYLQFGLTMAIAIGFSALNALTLSPALCAIFLKPHDEHGEKKSTFISNRPVLSTVISVLIVILGLIGLATLPITQYPDIAPPTVSVRATYTGANAQTVLNSVIAPLEDQINGVENMMYMTSNATNSGSADISVYFKQGTDPDMAAVNVQNRVSMAQGLLPAEVTKVGVTTQKRQTSMLMVFSIYDETDQYNIEFLENYANINLIPEVKRVAGVGDAMVLGTDYSMRIWLKPDVMAQYKLIPNDVAAVLAEQNIEAAPGQFGERGNQTFQYTIRYKGRLQQPEEFENIVIKAMENGEVLRLKDIAEIELGRL